MLVKVLELCYYACNSGKQENSFREIVVANAIPVMLAPKSKYDDNIVENQKKFGLNWCCP